jgi:hypothetical protein
MRALRKKCSHIAINCFGAVNRRIVADYVFGGPQRPLRIAISASWSPPDIDATGTPIKNTPSAPPVEALFCWFDMTARRCLSACVQGPEFGIPAIFSGGVAHPARLASTDSVSTARLTIPPLFNKPTRRQHYVAHDIAQVLGAASHTIIFDKLGRASSLSGLYKCNSVGGGGQSRPKGLGRPCQEP